MVCLDFSENGFTEIPIVHDGVTQLNLSDNKITKLTKGCFPSGLQKINLSGNKITKLTEGCFPSGLQEINLSYNEITKLPKGCFPSGLQKINLSYNKITKLTEGYFPSGLQEINLSYNKITKLPKGCFPHGLQELWLSANKITSLTQGCFPSGLQILYVNANKITSLTPKCFPFGLQKLYLGGNGITELPLFLLELRHLDVFFRGNNPIENIHPLVDQWLEKLDEGLGDNNKVYSDSQNIHNSNIQVSFRNSLENLLKDEDEDVIPLIECKQYVIESNELDEQVTRELFNYCDDPTKHSVYLVRFEEVFRYVITRIVKHSDPNELFGILNAEIKDNIRKCSTEHMTRLVNVLDGYYDDINIQI